MTTTSSKLAVQEFAAASPISMAPGVGRAHVPAPDRTGHAVHLELQVAVGRRPGAELEAGPRAEREDEARVHLGPGHVRADVELPVGVHEHPTDRTVGGGAQAEQDRRGRLPAHVHRDARRTPRERWPRRTPCVPEARVPLTSALADGAVPVGAPVVPSLREADHVRPGVEPEVEVLLDEGRRLDRRRRRRSLACRPRTLDQSRLSTPGPLSWTSEAGTGRRSARSTRRRLAVGRGREQLPAGEHRGPRTLLQSRPSPSPLTTRAGSVLMRPFSTPKPTS